VKRYIFYEKLLLPKTTTLSNLKNYLVAFSPACWTYILEISIYLELQILGITTKKFPQGITNRGR
jgi:hypothetical protein